MNITVEHKIADYHILQVDVTENMPKGDLWGKDWFPEVDAWCYESFGAQDIWGEPVVNGWKRMRNKYFFRDEDMLTMFKLRFG